MPSILTKATAAGPSSEFTLAAGDIATLSLNPDRAPFVASDIECVVQYKTSDNTWVNAGVLNASAPLMVAQGPGTYRVYRRDCTTSVGVDKV